MTSRGQTKRIATSTAVAITAVLAIGATAAVAKFDFGFGVERDEELAKHSEKLFGVGKPLAESSTASTTQAEAQADPTHLVTVAKRLKANVVSTEGPPNYDQISLWPDGNHPTFLIVCNEGDADEPGLVRIELATGIATTILSGTEDCDPTRLTPWGTILFGEEGGQDGSLYELIDPLNTTDVTLDRATGVFSGGTGAENLVRRDAMGKAAFEGIGILADGTTYLDEDDDDIGPVNGGPGNEFYKFTPTTPLTTSDPITDLSQSPLAAGSVAALRVGLEDDYGQGREFGFAQWIPLPTGDNVNLEVESLAAGITGYFRLEDADLDPIAMEQGLVRVCSPSTGDEANHLYGEVVCVTDGTVEQAMANTARTEVQPFQIGGTSQGINMPDNIAFQPYTGNVILHEDASTRFEGPHNNDLWDCLPDGADQDLLSDGCIRIGTLNDLTAEWTGGIFDASGKHFYVSVQHNISGQGTILDITGWR